MSICVRGINFAFVYTIFQFDFLKLLTWCKISVLFLDTLPLNHLIILQMDQLTVSLKPVSRKRRRKCTKSYDRFTNI